jgi:5-methyltetrahydrofolate--homocysteine methyltransferase
MTVISGALNTSREGLSRMVEIRDEKGIIELIQHQISRGADYLDLNCGNRVATEKSDLSWLIEVAQKACDLPLCLDSPNMEVLNECHTWVNNKKQMIFNSISAESFRMEKILPLLKELNCFAVALLMDESGIPENIENRMKCMSKIDEAVKKTGIDPSHIIIDPLVMPLGVQDSAGRIFLDLISQIRKDYPAYRICGGIDNVSFGLPMRSQIKQTAIGMSLARGLDTLLAVLDDETFQTLNLSRLVLGNDPFCGDFLDYYRKEIEETTGV